MVKGKLFFLPDGSMKFAQFKQLFIRIWARDSWNSGCGNNIELNIQITSPCYRPTKSEFQLS